MTVIDAQHKKKILKDLDKANNEIREVLDTGVNLFVRSPSHYLTPTVMGTRQPFNGSRGQLEHYKSIRAALEGILAGEEVGPRECLRRAPYYVKKYLT